MMVILMAGLSFTMSAQDFVEVKEAVQRIDAELNALPQGDVFSFNDLAGNQLKTYYYSSVKQELLADNGKEIGSIITDVYNVLTQNGQNKKATEMNTFRIQLTSLLES